jgi:hypothetical protein
MQTLKRLLFSLVQRVLKRFNYKLAPHPTGPPMDLRQPLIHPGSVQYLSHLRPALIDVDIARGRGFRVIPLDTDLHPFVCALREALTAEDREAAICAALRSYYEATQPASAAEWLDLPAGAGALLHHAPPWAVTMPWDFRTPEQWRVENKSYVLKENQRYQRSGQPLTIESGWHFWGPVSDAKLMVETSRLDSLVSSMLANGYVRHDGPDGDVCAVVLTRGSDWRWHVLGGEHRAAACSALGIATIPVRVLQVVNRAEVDFWPGVARRYFSRDVALAVFDKVFDGRVPAVMQGWQASQTAAVCHQPPRRISRRS